MKKLITIISLLFIIQSIQAQSHFDALLLSKTANYGSSRYMAMGGAFTALGGDLTVLSTNPAGMSIYRKGELGFTPALYNSETKSVFNGNSMLDNKYSFNMNNMGIVASFSDEDFGGWRGLAFGFAYNRLADFNENVIIEGPNSTGSMLDYWMLNSDGLMPDQLNSFGEFLAWDNYLLDTLSGTNLLYTNPHQWNSTVYEQTQRKVINRKGGAGSYDFAFSANFKDIIYIGTSLGVQSIRYIENSTYTEIDLPDNVDYSSFDYQEHLKAEGAGLNFKLGFIIRPVSFIRIGASIHTPTFYAINEKYYSSLASVWDEPDFNGYTSYESISPNNEYDYELTTPLKSQIGAAIIIPRFGLVSIDYEFVDYSKIRMRADDYDYFDENNAITRQFNKTSNIRLGAEFVMGPISLRGGYALFGNPYTPEANRIDALTSQVSGGLGLKSENLYVDMAFIYALNKDNYDFYYPVNTGETVPQIDRTMSSILITFGVKF